MGYTREQGHCNIELSKMPNGWDSTVSYRPRRGTAPVAVCKRSTVRQIVHKIVVGLLCVIAGLCIAWAFLLVILERCGRLG